MIAKIPTYIIEEHHEAFIVWHHVIQQGYIASSGNTLFHVDEHSDMGCPRFNSSINDLNGEHDKVIEFTYSELSIADFIIPSIYKGYFDKIFWVRQNHRSKKRKSVNMFVRSYNRDGKRLLSGKINDLVRTDDLQTYESDTDFQKFKYNLRTIDQIPSGLNVVLDIDLDYFSCSGNPTELEELYIEITKDEYDTFINNRYHRIHYMNIGRKIKVEKYYDKYYYVINDFEEIYPNKLRVDNDVIIERIKYFIDKLTNKKVVPKIICICRSRYSGYTPTDQWELIERELLSRLQEKYKISIKHI